MRSNSLKIIVFDEPRPLSLAFPANYPVFPDSCFRHKLMVIIPLASLTGTYLMRDNFKERDAGALALDADSDHASSLVGSLGLRLTKDYRLPSGTITPEIRVKWDHEFMNDDYALNASFTGYPASTFTVKGDRPHRDSLGAGFGLAWQTKENMYLHLTYYGSFSGDNTQHAGTLGMRYRW